MDEQKQIKQMLAERCAAKGKTPVYITKVHGIQDIFGQPVALSDLKTGRIYKISIDKQLMENANVVAVHHHRDRDDEWTTHNTMSSTHLEKQIIVTDILHHDGMVFIETPGMALSTIDFPKEWNYVLENAENQKFTNLVLHAIDEQDKWFKDDSIKLATQLNIMDYVHKIGNVQEVLNGMTSAIYDYIQENKPQIPFDKRTTFEIEDIAKKYVLNRIREIESQEKLTIARELAATGVPLVYCFYKLKPENGWKPDLKGEQHVPDKKFTTFSLNIPMGPMTGNDRFGPSPFRMRDMVLLDVKKTESGKVFYITDRAILTNVNMHDEYKQALVERGIEEDKLRPGMSMRAYMSVMNPNNRDIFGSRYYLSLEHYDGQRWVSDMEQVRSAYDDICTNLAKHGTTPTLIKDNEYADVSNIRMLDANGVQHDISLSDVCPGMKIIIIEERETFDDNKIAGNGSVMEVQEFLSIGGKEFAIITDKGMFTNSQSFMDQYNEFVQTQDHESVELENEGPIIGQ